VISLLQYFALLQCDAEVDGTDFDGLSHSKSGLVSGMEGSTSPSWLGESKPRWAAVSGSGPTNTLALGGDELLLSMAAELRDYRYENKLAFC